MKEGKGEGWICYRTIVVGLEGFDDATTSHVGVGVGSGAGDVRFHGPSYCRRRRGSPPSARDSGGVRVKT